MLSQSHVRSGEPELICSGRSGNPLAELALSALAIISNPFRLYHYHVNGISAQELAAVFDLPVSWVEQRIEAVRLCVEYQLAFTFEPIPEQQANEAHRAAAASCVRES